MIKKFIRAFFILLISYSSAYADDNYYNCRYTFRGEGSYDSTPFHNTAMFYSMIAIQSPEIDVKVHESNQTLTYLESTEYAKRLRENLGTVSWILYGDWAKIWAGHYDIIRQEESAYSGIGYCGPVCRNVRIDPTPRSWSFFITSKSAFNNSTDYYYPVGNKKIEMPIYPKNEYERHVINFYIDTKYKANITGLSNVVPSSLSLALNKSRIECVRDATPLTLTLSTRRIDFEVMQGAPTTISKVLKWQTSGRGMAGRWTIRFDSVDNSHTYDSLILGNAQVFIRDDIGNLVRPANDVPIRGTYGLFWFHLDPKKANVGDFTKEIRVTISAI
ncbi:TPA: hypothetical protein O7142_003959 [Salmonella enterica]|nr:hypothetical protein [Salmonella enterica subsp. diarizonae]HDC2661440.1 hypothetical protein [Salmonella enterica]